MKAILFVAIVIGVVNCVSAMPPNIHFDCNPPFIEVRFNETYLDGLVVMPVRSVFFIKPTDNMGQILSQNPPVSNCSTTDTGNYLSINFTNFQECAFSSSQSGGNISFTYRGVLLTMHDSVVERDIRHFFTFQCFYKDSYNVSTGGIMTYLSNFFSGDTGATTITPLVSLWYDAAHTIPLPTDRGAPSSQNVYVTISSGSTFQIEIINCATSVERAYGDRSQVDFIWNGAAVEASVVITSLKATTAAFSFKPVVNSFGDKNVTMVCEVEVCDLVDSPGGCSKRRKRDADESSENPHYIVTASFRILPDSDPLYDEPRQAQPVPDLLSDPVLPEDTDLEPSTTSSESPTTPQPSTTTTSEPTTATTKPATTPESSTTTTEPSTTISKPSTTATTAEPSTTTTSTIVHKTPKNRKPHKVQQHKNPRQGQISRVTDDGNGDDVTNHDQKVRESFFDYMKKADVLFYVAIALMALMVVLMVVVMYRRCVRNKKVAHVGDEERAQN